MVESYKTDIEGLNSEIIRLQVRFSQEHQLVQAEEKDETVDLQKYEVQIKDLTEKIVSLQHEKHACEVSLQSADDSQKEMQLKNTTLNEKIESMLKTHADIEKSWNLGLNALKDEYESKVFSLRKSETDLKQLIAEATIREEELKHSLTLEEQKFVQSTHAYEREMLQCNQSAKIHKEQCEQSEQRMLEMHKSVIHELKERDKLAREDQIRIQNERIQSEIKYADTIRQMEQSRHENRELKRKIDDFALVDQEHKRLKQENSEQCHSIVRMQSENAQLQKDNANLREDAEKLRKEIMKIRSENAVLAVEKRFVETRKRIETN
jgi:hypothetical protein